MAAPSESKGGGEVVFDIRGPRGALTVERATELCQVINDVDDPPFTKAIISTWAFDEPAAIIVANALKKCTRLTDLDASDIIAGRLESIGLAVYKVLADTLGGMKLKALDLSNNAVGPKGLVALEGLLQNPHLEDVRFCNCGISAEAMTTICDLLLKAGNPTKLTGLHFHNNMSGGGGAIALADLVSKSPLLRSVRFSSSRGTPEGGVALAKSLSASTSFEHVQFDDNMFKPDIAAPLAESLSKQPNLTFLSVADVGLEDEGIETLVSSVIKSNPKVTTFNINGTEITEAGAKFVGTALHKLTNLVSMNAEDNEFETAGALSIAKRLRRRAREGDSLRTLNFSGNMISTKGALALAKAAEGRGLTSFVVDGNSVSDAGIEELQKLFGDALGSLDLNDEPDEDEDDDAEESEDSGGEDAPAPAPETAEVAGLSEALGGMSV